MTDAQRWLAIDADLMGKPFTLDLYHRFGWAGIGTWIAFLCACKRSRTPGSFRFLNESDACAQLGILGWDLVDNKGESWDLNDFWTYTGRKKQTRRTSRGREMNVRATHWGHWQNRTSHRKNGGPGKPLARGEASADLDLDLDHDTPLPPKGGSGRRSASNGKSLQPKDPPRPVIPEWQPDPEPEEPPIDRAAVQALRNHQRPDQS